MNGVIILRINLSKGWLCQNNPANNYLIAKATPDSVQRTIKLVHLFSVKLIAEQIKLNRCTFHAQSRAADAHAAKRQEADIAL